MKIVVIGSGAREHALVQALARSSQKPEIYCYGTSINPGIHALSRGYAVGNMTDCPSVLKQLLDWQVDFALIGPEAPLEKGLADVLWAQNIPVIGPRQASAALETSKVFTRELMQKYHINGLPKFAQFSSMQGIAEFLNELGDGQYVIKANGLMGGKGVKVAGDHLQNFTQALQFCQEILATGQEVLIEEKLVGEEFSCICFADGSRLIAMPLVQDHKRAFVGDKGPNTGGMGSYSDANHLLPFLTPNERDEALAINQKVYDALHEETGQDYIGFLYGSYIATRHGVYVIEFNARLGDPEALNLLSLLESDFVSICQAMLAGKLTHEQVKFAHKASVCKYAVPIGYPDAPEKGFVVDTSQVKNVDYLYWAAVDLQDKHIVATGSRALACVGVADELAKAEARAQEGISAVRGRLFHREDIGKAELIEQRIAHMQRLRDL